MKKRLEGIFHVYAYGVNDLSHLVVLLIFETINWVLVKVAASSRLLVLFLSDSSQESMLLRTLR